MPSRLHGARPSSPGAPPPHWRANNMTNNDSASGDLGSETVDEHQPQPDNCRHPSPESALDSNDYQHPPATTHRAPWASDADANLLLQLASTRTTHKPSCTLPAKPLPSGRISKHSRGRPPTTSAPSVSAAAHADDAQPWTTHEDFCLASHHAVHGPKWALLAQSMPHRRQQSIKNRWHSTCRTVRAGPASKPPSSALHSYVKALLAGCSPEAACQVCLQHVRLLAAANNSSSSTLPSMAAIGLECADDMDEHDDCMLEASSAATGDKHWPDRTGSITSPLDAQQHSSSSTTHPLPAPTAAKARLRLAPPIPAHSAAIMDGIADTPDSQSSHCEPHSHAPTPALHPGHPLEPASNPLGHLPQLQLQPQPHVRPLQPPDSTTTATHPSPMPAARLTLHPPRYQPLLCNPVTQPLPPAQPPTPLQHRLTPPSAPPSQALQPQLHRPAPRSNCPQLLLTATHSTHLQIARTSPCQTPRQPDAPLPYAISSAPQQAPPRYLALPTPPILTPRAMAAATHPPTSHQPPITPLPSGPHHLSLAPTSQACHPHLASIPTPLPVGPFSPTLLDPASCPPQQRRPPPTQLACSQPTITPAATTATSTPNSLLSNPQTTAALTSAPANPYLPNAISSQLVQRASFFATMAGLHMQAAATIQMNHLPTSGGPEAASKAAAWPNDNALATAPQTPAAVPASTQPMPQAAHQGAGTLGLGAGLDALLLGLSGQADAGQVQGWGTADPQAAELNWQQQQQQQQQQLLLQLLQQQQCQDAHHLQQAVAGALQGPLMGTRPTLATGVAAEMSALLAAHRQQQQQQHADRSLPGGLLQAAGAGHHLPLQAEVLAASVDTEMSLEFGELLEGDLWG